MDSGVHKRLLPFDGGGGENPPEKDLRTSQEKIDDYKKLIYRICNLNHYHPSQVYNMNENDFFGLIEDIDDLKNKDKNKKPKQYQIDMINKVKENYEKCQM